MRFLDEANRFPTALIGLAVIVALTLGAFFVDELPVIGSGPSYRAEFSEAAGLRTTTRSGSPGSASAA